VYLISNRLDDQCTGCVFVNKPDNAANAREYNIVVVFEDKVDRRVYVYLPQHRCWHHGDIYGLRDSAESGEHAVKNHPALRYLHIDVVALVPPDLPGTDLIAFIRQAASKTFRADVKGLGLYKNPAQPVIDLKMKKFVGFYSVVKLFPVVPEAGEFIVKTGLRFGAEIDDTAIFGVLETQNNGVVLKIYLVQNINELLANDKGVIVFRYRFI
jgi:hypothetical protein